MENRCYHQPIPGLVLEPQSGIVHPIATEIDKTHFVLNTHYVYYWQMEAGNADNEEETFPIDTWIVVQSGFRWDGASVPKFFWGLGFETDGKHRAAALIHDFIYVNKGKMPSGSMFSTYSGLTEQMQHGSFSRYDADRLFLKMMAQAGVGPIRRKLMWFAVSKFGWIFWQDGPDLFRALLFKTVSFLMIIAILVLLILN